MKLSRRSMFAMTGAAVGGMYGLSRSGWLDFFSEDERDRNPAQVKRLEYPAEKGRMLSLLGFGCMRFPIIGQNKLDIDEELTGKMFDYAIRHGVNYFDTAWMYMSGKSAAVVGRALEKYPRESLFIVNKMPAMGSWAKNLDEAKKIFEKQLADCRTAYFDNYLCHNISSWHQFKSRYIDGGILRFLLDQREKGTIRHLGFSFHGDSDLLKRMLDYQEAKWECCMLMINALDWNERDEDTETQSGKFSMRLAAPAGTHYRLAASANLPVFAMEPLRGGTMVTLNRLAVRKLQAVRPKNSVASWGLRFVASLPKVQSVLSGMSRMSDVVDNVKTMSEFEPMSPAEYKVLKSALDDFKKQKIYPCTSCDYCMPCKYGVNIPKVFKIYNDASGDGALGAAGDGKGATDAEKRAFIVRYNNSLAPRTGAEHCISCAKCESVCPQHIAISKEMPVIASLVKNLKKELSPKRRKAKKENNNA